MSQIPFKTYIEFYHTAAWNVCGDVLQDPPPTWEYGLGPGLVDLVADTGMLSFTLDNSASNSAGLAGYYTVGHANAPVWFVDGLPMRVRCERQDDMTIATRFTGFMVGSWPSSGMYAADTTEVEARDWLDYAASQKIGILAMQTNKRADEALTLALANFPIQPTATDFDVGRETFPRIFDTDTVDMTMMALFQKLALNECMGFIFLEGDGTLRFDNRHVRPLTAADAFAFDATGSTPMAEFDVSWGRNKIVNRIEIDSAPPQIDTGANTVLWTLPQPFPLLPGEVREMDLPFRDPDTGEAISAANVVNPLVSVTHIAFGSTSGGATNDLIASLTFPMTVGGNSAHVTLTNIGANAGHVNKLEIMGDGYYTYERIKDTVEDATSIAAWGERPLGISLMQVGDGTVRLFSQTLLAAVKNPVLTVERLRFLANFSDDFATAALNVEPNTRFGIIEGQTAVSGSFFAGRLRFEAVGQLLWVDIVPVPVAGGNITYFIWDEADHGWDEGVWIF